MVALAGTFFGMLSIFNRKLAAAGLAVIPILAVRFTLGAAALWLLLGIRGEWRIPQLRRSLAFGFMGLLYAVGSWLYFESARLIPVALTALLLYLYPALVMAASWLLWAEKPRGKAVLALAFALLGLGLAVRAPGPANNPWGLLFGLTTAFTYTTYLLMGSRLQERISPLLTSAMILTVAGLSLTVLALLQGGLAVAPLRAAWLPLGGLVVVGTVLPIPLLLAGLARIGPARTSIISTLEPISAALFGAWFLGERLGLLQVCGGALVVAAVVLLAPHEAVKVEPETAP